jgi:hypothetical protein
MPGYVNCGLYHKPLLPQSARTEVRERLGDLGFGGTAAFDPTLSKADILLPATTGCTVSRPRRPPRPIPPFPENGRRWCPVAGRDRTNSDETSDHSQQCSDSPHPMRKWSDNPARSVFCATEQRDHDPLGLGSHFFSIRQTMV